MHFAEEFRGGRCPHALAGEPVADVGTVTLEQSHPLAVGDRVDRLWEVDDDDAVFVPENVVRAEVAVDDSIARHEVHRLDELRPRRQRFVLTQPCVHEPGGGLFGRPDQLDHDLGVELLHGIRHRGSCAPQTAQDFELRDEPELCPERHAGTGAVFHRLVHPAAAGALPVAGVVAEQAVFELPVPLGREHVGAPIEGALDEMDVGLLPRLEDAEVMLKRAV